MSTTIPQRLILPKTFDSRLILFLSVVLGFLIRIAYLIKYSIPQRDAFYYGEIIEKWNATGEFCPDKFVAPLSLFLIGIPNRLFGYNPIKGAIIVNLALGLLLIALFVKFAYHLTHSHLAETIVGIILATHPVFVTSSCDALRENSFLLFYIMNIIALYAYTQRKYYLLPLISLSAVSTFLCRFEGAELFIINYFLIICFPAKFSKQLIRKKTINILCYIVLCGVFLIVISTLIGIPMSYYSDHLTSFVLKKMHQTTPIAF